MRRFRCVLAIAIASLLIAAAPRQSERGDDEPRLPRPSRISWVPDTVEIVESVVFAEVDGPNGERIALELDAAFLRHSGEKPLPVMIYIHGGGWVGGSRELGLIPAIVYALGGYFGVTIDYRLADVAPFPAQVHDVKAAIRFIRANADELGVDPDRIGVMGHSAGGHLSALAATSANAAVLEGEVGEPAVGSEVRCAVTVSGPSDLTVTDMSPRARDVVDRFIGPGSDTERRERARLASPLTHVDADDPPILVIHGTDDRLVPLAQATLLVEALDAAGVVHDLVEIEGAGHFLPSTTDDIRAAIFLDEHLGGAAHDAMLELRQRFGGTLPTAGEGRR